MWLLSCVVTAIVCCNVALARDGLAVVQTAQDLRRAFEDPNTSEACLASDIALVDEVFPGGANALVVSSDLLIRPCNGSSTSDLPLLDFGYMQGRIRVQPNITITFENVIMKNPRARTGYALDILLSSPGASLVSSNTIRWLSACVPATSQLVNQALQQPRSPRAPGRQDVRSVPQEKCIRGTCFSDYLLFVNYTSSNLVPFAEGADEGGYDLLRFNDTRVCDAYITQQCIQDKGPDACLLDLISSQRNQSQPSTNGLLIKVLVPVASVAVLSVVLVAVLVWNKRRYAEPPADGQHEHSSSQSHIITYGASSPGTQPTSSTSPSSSSTSTLMASPSSGLRFIRGMMGSAPMSADSMPYVQLGIMIGAGSYGKVYRGMLAGKEVAVKVLEYDLRAAARVQNELDCATVLVHPNVVGALATITFGTPTSAAQVSTHSSGYRESASSAQRRRTMAAEAIPEEASLAPEGPPAAAQGSSAHQEDVTASQQPSSHSYSQSSTPPSSYRSLQLAQMTTAAASGATTSATSSAAQQRPEYAVQPSPGRRNISDVLSTGASSGPAGVQLVTWIVMDYCDKGSLRAIAERMADQPMQLRLPFLLSRLLDVAQGMAYIHAQGICHGDLKSCNVLVASADRDAFGCVAKVSDFGLSRALAMGASHLSTRTYGTVTHMAPELLASGHLRQASDVYSYGIMMYEVLTGQRHYEGMMHGEVIHKVIIEHKRPELPPCLPPGLAALAARCWQHDPEARPSFLEVVAQLGGLLAQGELLLAAAGHSQQVGESLVSDF